jgi:selenocysteine lyase/cysteine desulfurase
MHYPRRAFLKKMGALSTTAAALPLFHPELSAQQNEKLKEWVEVDGAHLAKDEKFWAEIRQHYTVPSDYINLENGYYSMTANPVMDAQDQENRKVNLNPSIYMRQHKWKDYNKVKQAMADFAGCTPEEMVLCRNTTEALNTVILGLKMDAGDEAIMTNQDYGSMRAAFNQRARRDKIVNKVISLPLHPKNDQEIVDAYEKAISPKTKVILVTHLINITGQVLPVRKIADMAHSKGVEVISDSAHALGHIDFKITDLDCDYFGTSLHKWVGAPLGNGMMYIRKGKIDRVWPLLGDSSHAEDDIRKFEHWGTRPNAIINSILDALAFQDKIGIERKQARLRYLKQYWTKQIVDIPGIIINTPFEEERSSGIANVGVKGLPPAELANKLFNDFNIFTVAIDTEAVKGTRVTPHLYTKLEELDHLVTALKALSS